VSRPTYGDKPPEITAIGTNSSAAWVGDSPSTPWAYSIVGNAIAVTPNPTAAIATAARLKLRSRKSESDSSGSSFVRACQAMKTPRTTRPAMINDHTEIGPAIVPQW
jgi:hypothetical protein